MRHQKKTVKLGLTAAHRKALLANQVFLQLKTLHETLDVIAQDQVRIAARVEQIAATMERPVPTE